MTKTAMSGDLGLTVTQDNDDVYNFSFIDIEARNVELINNQFTYGVTDDISGSARLKIIEIPQPD